MNIPSLADLKARRRALKITQTQLSEASGVSLSTIMKMDSNCPPDSTLSTIQKIDAALTRLESEQASAPDQAATR